MNSKSELLRRCIQDPFGMAETLWKMQEAISRLGGEVLAQQAKIDALMFEYCPKEMTPEQIENWATCQSKTKEEENIVLRKAIQPALYIDPGDLPLTSEAAMIYVTTSSFDDNTLPLYRSSES